MAEYHQVDKEKLEKEFSDFCEQLLYRKFFEVAIYTGSSFALPLIYLLESVTDIDSIAYPGNIMRN